MGAWRGPGQDAGSPRGHVAGKGRGRAAGGEGVAAPASSSHRMDAIAPDSPCPPHPEIAAASAGEGAAAPPDRAARELVLRTIAAHAPSLLGTARRYSLCRDDAEDAYQRALEIFLRRYDEIASGRECERWTPVLSALADGEASAADIAAARPHLRACPACRAALRDFRLAPGTVAALVPVAASADAHGGLASQAWE